MINRFSINVERYFSGKAKSFQKWCWEGAKAVRPIETEDRILGPGASRGGWRVTACRAPFLVGNDTSSGDPWTAETVAQ